MNFKDSNLFAKLTQLAATPGKKDKQKIVETFTTTEQQLVRLALDPTKMFYIAKIDYTGATGIESFGVDELDLLEALHSRTITGNEAQETVGYHLRALTPESGELLKRIITKDLKCGVGVTMVNSVFFGLVPDYPYMRCSLPKDSNIKKWDEGAWKAGVFAQLKADGMFARIDVDADGSIEITSRQGNTFPPGALRTLENSASRVLQPGTETHGELTVWIKGELQPRSAGNGMLNSLQGGGELPDGAEVRFDAWDQIPLSAAVVKGQWLEPYESRLLALTKQIEASCSESIALVEGRKVHTYAEASTYYKEVLARKLEGIILKHPDTVWRDGDSKDQVKFKLEVDVDLMITGFRPGEVGKRTEATFGSVLCQTLDGELEVAVSGFKRDMELYLHENRDSVMHKVMCVRANAVSAPCDTNEKFSLYHPRFVELRKDKDTPDTLAQVLAQFEAATSI